MNNLKTDLYYNENADNFFSDTVNVKMDSIYQKFEKYLKSGSLVIDAGAGSGRDSAYFLTKNYEVYSFDNSLSLCKLSNSKLNLNMHCHNFFDLPSNIRPDAIWACASLLHLTKDELKKVFNLYSNILNDSGVFYVSFKYGSFSGEKNGRYFTDLTELELENLLASSKLKIKESWKTSDVRPGRENEFWLNAILTK